MAASSCPPVTVDIQHEGVSTAIELSGLLGCGSSATDKIHSLATEAGEVSSSLTSRTASLLATETQQKTMTTTKENTNLSSSPTVVVSGLPRLSANSSQRAVSSGLPWLTVNSSQTYHYTAAIPTFSPFVNRSAYNNVDPLWMNALCMLVLLVLLK